MTRLDYIREKILVFLNTGAEIHVSVSSTHPRTEVDNERAKIIGAYPNIFRIEAAGGTCYTVPYTDVLIGKVSIKEL